MARAFLRLTRRAMTTILALMIAASRRNSGARPTWRQKGPDVARRLSALVQERAQIAGRVALARCAGATGAEASVANVMKTKVARRMVNACQWTRSRLEVVATLPYRF
jgi:hypothetical protein